MVNRGARLALLAGAVVSALAVTLRVAPAQAVEVVVTIRPLHALVARVMAGAGSPHLLVQGALSPHIYALRPSDASKLNTADLFVRMSDAMEPFTTRIVKSLPRRVQVLTLEDTPGLRRLPRRTGATFAEAGNGHDHSHSHDHAAIDGHAWLDPMNAKHMADQIAETLSAKAPAEAATFRANAAELKTALDALSAELASDLAPLAGKPYVVFHDALQYFEQRYGLRAVGSIAISPEIAPGVRRLSLLRQQIASLNAECVLAEPQLDMRLVNAVVEGTGARVGTIDPEGLRIAPGPDHYFTLLRGLARDLRACLAPTG
jgi:zinc transport system substrate-binding protein